MLAIGESDARSFSFRAKPVQLIRGIERIISPSGVNQLLCIGGIDLFPLTLTVRSVVSPETGAFIGKQSAPAEAFHDILLRTWHIAGLVCIFDPKQKITSMFFGKQVIEQGRPDSAHMKGPCGTGCKAHANSL